MVVRRMFYVACDGCGTPEEFQESSKAAREYAKENLGYARRGGKDLCPRCQAPSAIEAKPKEAR